MNYIKLTTTCGWQLFPIQQIKRVRQLLHGSVVVTGYKEVETEVLESIDVIHQAIRGEQERVIKLANSARALPVAELIKRANRRKT